MKKEENKVYRLLFELALAVLKKAVKRTTNDIDDNVIEIVETAYYGAKK